LNSIADYNSRKRWPERRELQRNNQEKTFFCVTINRGGGSALWGGLRFKEGLNTAITGGRIYPEETGLEQGKRFQKASRGAQ